MSVLTRGHSRSALAVLLLSVACVDGSDRTLAPRSPAVPEPSADAARISDQVNPADPSPAFNYAIGGNSNQQLAQTVTPSVSGFLTAILVPVSCAPGASLTLEIRNVDPTGAPGTRLRATSVFPDREFPPFTTPAALVALRVFPHVELAMGRPFAFVLRAQGSCGMVPALRGDTYAAGAGWYDARPNLPGWVALGGDLAFTTRMLTP
ncbi:MAG: hypothetical protein JNJ98_09330 [Gemmatimonadetes bacterium]|nr:hypothetical protein [Gemmatimonadota bacterium]